ncbi:Exocyst complex component S5 [Didymosphaeria variabile]|uniref:Exocyst complex component SEC5 n=1 Tax=Didymosphaeria variabile TaxID=1932322 RepID=A0A9W8XPJ4_9PLEO|nr:Exocyst complex component S5 [Didymosphaeria variabile]KAJ4354257.1 Exocyst complex component S5 [Didymosphaeria variabile]
MESIETQLLNKYNIPTLFPAQWPEEKDNSSDSEDDAPAPQRPPTLQPIRRSKSRFSVLETSGSFTRKRDGVEKTKEGVENLVQKDEQDPLGTYPSVVQVLRQRGLAVEDDVKLRNRFLLSSTTFSPSLFLSNVHSSASTDSLLSGLDFLSRSIEKKSASLKVLVEANFERFVGAKATIDRVYSEMRADGQEAPEPPPSPSGRPGHSRGPSRSSFSARPRGASATLTPQAVAQANGEKKKNALVKESEYGVHGIKVPLTEVAVKAEEVWGPALGGKDKEDTLKEILSSVEKNRGLFEVGSAIQDAIRRKDHETIVDEYTRARKFAEDTRYIVEQATYSKTPLTDSQIHQIIVTARMWADVEHQVESFKRDAWKRLTSTHFSRHVTGIEQSKEQYMELISIMLELGVEDSPIWVWLLSRYEHLRKRLLESCDRARMEIEFLRRLLGNQPKPGLKTLLKHLRAVPTNSKITAEPAKLDTLKTIEFWEHVHASMTGLLAANGGILGEIVEYWDIAQSFIDGKAQKSLPMGFNNQSSVHHNLSSSNVTELEKGITELVNIIREHLFSFFAEPPIEDITSLYSPLPTSPTPTTPRTPMSAALSPTMGSKFRFDPNSAPPPSPKRGDAWEKYAFWPPHSNALSGSHYLAKSLVLIGTAANELASLRLNETGATVRLDEALRVLVGGVRERCVQAVCAAWNTDAESLKVLEDWTRDADRKDITTMPTRFLAVQSFLLNNLQKIMYVEASSKTTVDVLVSPSSKLLQMVRSQFVTSLYRTLSGMVECAEKGRAALGKEFEVKSDELTIDDEESRYGGWGKVDASKRSIRLLLTLSNMTSFQTEITPQLITLFETLFSVSLTDESKKVDGVLSQLDAQLFKSYNQPHAARIAGTIEAGIFSPQWAPPSEPGKSVADRQPSPYVFTILLGLVLVHTEVSTTSPPDPRILRALFEATTTSLIKTFNDPRLSNINLQALMQATLDVEFMAQTLASYTTEAASATQTEIYQVLDGKTDNEARVRLQGELGNLRGTLKGLREGTRVEFSCFRREKRAR